MMKATDMQKRKIRIFSSIQRSFSCSSFCSASRMVRVERNKENLETRRNGGSEGVEYSELTNKIIGAAMKVHSTIGPGVLESVYRTCMAHELKKLGLGVSCEVVLPVVYDGLRLDSGFRIDLLVEDLVVV